MGGLTDYKCFINDSYNKFFLLDSKIGPQWVIPSSNEQNGSPYFCKSIICQLKHPLLRLAICWCKGFINKIGFVLPVKFASGLKIFRTNNMPKGGFCSCLIACCYYL